VIYALRRIVALIRIAELLTKIVGVGPNNVIDYARVKMAIFERILPTAVDDLSAETAGKTALIAKVTGYGHDAASQVNRLPIWVTFIVVVRAGVVEELFYRGYSIERLEGLGFGRFASLVIPLLIFSAAHWSGGGTNILMALVLGTILTAFYQWRRDLVSNIFGHFLLDFMANVLPAVLS
jgi:membrane protease YdiL (CAAX protease family)